MSNWFVKFYGVRGSIPVSGKEYVEFGGSTSCVYIETEEVRLVIDSGTGIRNLGIDLMNNGLKSKKPLYMLFTHTHWDHLQGFPFFLPAYTSEIHLEIFGELKRVPTLDQFGNKKLEDWSIERTLQMQQHVMYFPVDTNLNTNNTFHNIVSGDKHIFGDLRVEAFALEHPNSSLGFRFDCGESSFVFCTDVEHSPKMTEVIAEKAAGTNALAYDAQYTPEEYEEHMGWGHSTWVEGIKIAKLAGTKQLLLIHHSPFHYDDTLKNIEINAKKDHPSTISVREGMEFTFRK